MIKKLIKILAVVFMLTATGCGSSSNTVCTKKEDAGVSYETTLDYKDSNVTEIKQVSKINYKAGYITKKDAEETAKGLKKAYNKIDGVEYEYDATDSSMEETFTFTVDAKTLKSFKKNGMLNNYISKDGKSIKLKTAKSQLEKNGFKCK